MANYTLAVGGDGRMRVKNAYAANDKLRLTIGSDVLDLVLAAGARTLTFPGTGGTFATEAYVDAAIATEDTIAELNDTAVSTPAAGHLLIYDATQAQWENAVLTAGSNISVTNGDGAITLAATDTNTTYSAGDGVALSGTTFAADTLANSGITIASNKISLDLGANSITGTLGVGDGGTGQTSYTDGQLLVGNSSGNTLAKATLTAGSNVSVTNGNGTITIASTDTNTTYSGGDGIALSGTTFAADPLVNSGVVIASNKISLDLGASSITGTLAVGDGGTGASTLTDGGILLGSGTGAITATAVLADGEMLVGDGTSDPAIESGATLRTSIGLGTGNNVQFTDLLVTGNMDVNGTLTTVNTTDIVIEDKDFVTATPGGLSDAMNHGTQNPVQIVSTGHGFATNDYVYFTASAVISGVLQITKIDNNTFTVAVDNSSGSSGTVRHAITKCSTAAVTNAGWFMPGATSLEYIKFDGADYTMSQSLDLQSGKVLKINNTEVLSATALASAVKLNNDNWNGTDLAVANGGTGQSSYTDGQLLIGNSSGNTLAKATLTAGSNIAITNGNGTISIASTDTNTTYSAGDGLVLSGTTFSVDGPLQDLDTLGANNNADEFLVSTGAGALAWEAGSTARTSLGLGDIATQAANSVDINGGAIDGVTIGTNSVCTQLVVDTITIDGGTISTSASNNAITFDTHGTGDYVFSGSTDNALDFASGMTLKTNAPTGESNVFEWKDMKPGVLTFTSGGCTAFDIVYLDEATDRVKPYGSSVGSGVGLSFVGIALATVADGSMVRVAVDGTEVIDASWNWGPGEPLYAGATAGDVVSSAPTTGEVVKIGVALTSTKILLASQYMFDYS